MVGDYGKAVLAELEYALRKCCKLSYMYKEDAWENQGEDDR